jgi:ariadne-1
LKFKTLYDDDPRLQANEKSQQKAKTDLKETGENKLNLLSNCQSTPLSQLKFVTDALAQIVECRRILKWTYGYGYCFFDSYATPEGRNFFEFMQVSVTYV